MNRHTDPDHAVSPHGLGAVAQRILVTNVVPFWERSVDRQQGGYRLNHDANGQWRGPADKYLVTQARTLWYFSRLAREGLVSGEGADIGYRFMRGHMWDHENGGFYWAVDYEGARPTKPGKHLYGQAFALFALCEYALTTGQPEAGELCRFLFEIIDRRAYDQGQLGYRESFAVDWSQPSEHSVGHLGAPPDHKLFNTHLHLLEAITSFVQLNGDGLPRRRLDELIEVCGWCVVDEDTGGCRDEFLEDWSPLRGSEYDRASYGHDLENVALLLRAARLLGTVEEELLRRCCKICEHTLTHGCDIDYGGFFASGPLGEPADRREKVYWVQAEALFGLLRMWQLTREPGYLESLRHTLEWVDGAQVDRAGGDWHGVIAPTGATSGNKADQWKDPYHQTRALLEVSALADYPARLSVPGL